MIINGIFNANTGTIEFANGGNFTNNGTFNRGTSTVDFTNAGTGTVGGTALTSFHNIRLYPGGGINFGAGALRGHVSGTFELRPWQLRYWQRPDLRCRIETSLCRRRNV